MKQSSSAGYGYFDTNRFHAGSSPAAVYGVVQLAEQSALKTPCSVFSAFFVCYRKSRYSLRCQRDFSGLRKKLKRGGAFVWKDICSAPWLSRLLSFLYHPDY